VKKTFFLRNEAIRRRVQERVWDEPDGTQVTFSDDPRTLEQNAKFHALVTDISKSGMEWAGKKRNPQQWKVLLVSGHAVATKEGSEIVPGIEGEFVNIRESTALMSKKRGSSLIEYTLCFAAMNNVRMTDYETGEITGVAA